MVLCFDFAELSVKCTLIVDIKAAFRAADVSHDISAVDSGVASSSLIHLWCLKGPEKIAPSLFWFPDWSEEVMNRVWNVSLLSASAVNVISETSVVASRDCYGVTSPKTCSKSNWSNTITTRNSHVWGWTRSALHLYIQLVVFVLMWFSCGSNHLQVTNQLNLHSKPSHLQQTVHTSARLVLINLSCNKYAYFNASLALNGVFPAPEVLS